MVALRAWPKGSGLAPFGLLTLAFALLPVPIGTQDLSARFSNQAAALPLAAAVDFPKVDRRLKGDFLITVALPLQLEPDPVPSERTREAHAALAPEWGPDIAPDESVPELGSVELTPSDSPTMDTARLYFGADSMEAPSTALVPPDADDDLGFAVPMPAPRPEAAAGAERATVKGKAASSPAARLRLYGKARAKAEKCLAEAVYFESRGETVRGQIAVAQVVMNRVFSEFYPDTVCEVVYQNAHRYNACQFTFACDGIRDVVRDQDAWRRAMRIAKGTLDGKLWLDDIGKATHYHAYWVRPWWISTMRRLQQIGVHSFYRPHRWGDGSSEPVWGDAKATMALAKTL